MTSMGLGFSLGLSFPRPTHADWLAQGLEGKWGLSHHAGGEATTGYKQCVCVCYVCAVCAHVCMYVVCVVCVCVCGVWCVCVMYVCVYVCVTYSVWMVVVGSRVWPKRQKKAYRNMQSPSDGPFTTVSCLHITVLFLPEHRELNIKRKNTLETETLLSMAIY